MTEETKTVIRPDVEKYQKARAASGSYSQHNGDPVAVALQGANLDEVYSLASEVTGVPESDLHAKYDHLNPGQQRMSLGNRIRGVVNKMNKTEGGSGDKFIGDVSSGLRENVEKREAALNEKREKAEAEKAAKAAEKAKAESAEVAEEKPKPKRKPKAA